MDKFGFNGNYRFQAIMSCGYPLIALGGVAAYYFLLIRDGAAQFTEMAPLIVLGLVAWLAYELFKLYQRFSFSIGLSEEGIQMQDEPLVKWQEISSAQFHGKQFGSTSIITLFPKNGEPLKIPAAINHLQVIQGMIENKVPDITNKD